MGLCCDAPAPPDPAIAAISSSESLRKQFECSICLELMHNPCTVPCGHSFCRTCLGDWIQSQTLLGGSPLLPSSTLAPCPLDRVPFDTLPEINVVLRGIIVGLYSSESEARQKEINAVSGKKALEAREAGNTSFRSGRHTDAVRFFSAAITFEPLNHLLWSNRSAAYALKHDYQRALADADKCISLRGDWYKGFSRRGFALFHLGSYVEAAAAYEAGLKLNPSDAEMTTSLDEARRAAGRSR
eukprot:gnl/Spiro4/9972_TR5299_c0_g1_i1.p1 gnl/Spiro4/9972_TR5299_c0_g1~~gnl/Spiro4/9972_TR5299_c0_g1_i1.p1  ORF type:complete len:242 (-),score=6.56 gnl/Spiro4/9972_TR5299_c0_g1_i1:192-917(-)